ncbi:hypothetical protein K0M31_002978 [Melipona bicolor]|uniref:Uncharacterized protein n=1 Tax=Melipona bicolor TaxID=60889 RepID=A0AA40KQ09_9HYME|nr:hypothetical protein K0M31_002978 [Melipona bicolor]
MATLYVNSITQTAVRATLCINIVIRARANFLRSHFSQRQARVIHVLKAPYCAPRCLVYQRYPEERNRAKEPDRRIGRRGYKRRRISNDQKMSTSADKTCLCKLSWLKDAGNKAGEKEKRNVST